MDGTVFWQSVGLIGRGAILTVAFSILTMAFSLVVGGLLATFRTGPRRVLRRVSTGWVELFRNLPLLVLLEWLYYVVPSVTGVKVSGFATALIGFILYTSAFVSETFRAGLDSIPKDQMSAGLALGMTRRQVLFRVIWPQAVRRILPPLGTIWVQLFQNTSIVSFIGVGDMTFQAIAFENATFESLTVFSALALWYLVLGYPQAKAVDWVYRRFRIA